ncbi:hypothetical protein GCM10029976_055210 [Kribbella albertanoniae]
MGEVGGPLRWGWGVAGARSWRYGGGSADRQAITIGRIAVVPAWLRRAQAIVMACVSAPRIHCSRRDDATVLASASG